MVKDDSDESGADMFEYGNLVQAALLISCVYSERRGTVSSYVELTSWSQSRTSGKTLGTS